MATFRSYHGRPIDRGRERIEAPRLELLVACPAHHVHQLERTVQHRELHLARLPRRKPLHDLVVYAKQVVMGIIVLLSPTPGGSGLAEFIFNDFLGMYVAPGLAPAIALLWRLLSYYPYILIGAILLPRWVRRNVIKPLVQPGQRNASAAERP